MGDRLLTSSYVGQHAWNQLTGVNINSVDIGAAFLPQNQDPTLSSARRRAPMPCPRTISARSAALGRSRCSSPSAGTRSTRSRPPSNVDSPRAFRLASTTRSRCRTISSRRCACSIASDGTYTRPGRPGAGAVVVETGSRPSHAEGEFRVGSAGLHAQPPCLCRRRQRLAIVGHLDGHDGRALHGGLSITGISALNLTGSADFAPRININGDPGSGCNNETRFVSSTRPPSRDRL